MLGLYIFILMFINSINHIQKNIHSIFINRISIIILMFSIFGTLNTLYFQSIGKGISLFTGLFQITIQSHIVEILLIIVGIFILLGWPLTTKLFSYPLSSALSLLPMVREGQVAAAPQKSSSPFVAIAKAAVGEGKRENEKVGVNSHAIKSVAPQQYSLIAIFSIVGGSMLMSSLDLLSMYLSIELQSFALYILATLNKEKLSSTSAGLKYFLLGSLSSCLILLGAAIIYSYTGLTQFEAINALISIPAIDNYYKEVNELSIDGSIRGLIGHGSSNLNTLPYFLSNFPLWDSRSNHADVDSIYNAFNIGLVIILIGFLFKISAAPFYQWAPDVYDGTPTIVTVWLTIVVKLTILIFLLNSLELLTPLKEMSLSTRSALEHITETYSNLTTIKRGNDTSKNLLLISSLFSLLIGTVVGLSQVKVKRLLAFSSISHVGFLLLGLGIFTPKSIDSYVFYLIQYSITSLNIFLILLAFGFIIKTVLLFTPSSTSYISTLNDNITSPGMPRVEVKNKEQVDIDINYILELKGQLHRNPILSISLAVCLFSMAGIPPLIGFFSKQFVLFSTIENGNYFLSIVAILVSVISASYYLRLVKITFFENLTTSGSTFADRTGLSRTIKVAAPQEGVPFTFFNLLVEKNSKRSAAREGGVDLIQPRVANLHSYIISVLTLIILFFFLCPSIILNGTQLISLTIFNL